jgi:hypothetical protein
MNPDRMFLIAKRLGLVRRCAGRWRPACASRRSPVAHRLAPRWLLGIEGDISWISLARTRTVPTIGPGKLRYDERYQSLAGQRARPRGVHWLEQDIILRHTTSQEEQHGPAPKYNGHMTRIIGADAAPLNRGALDECSDIDALDLCQEL